MMKLIRKFLFSCSFILFYSTAYSLEISLEDWAFNIDGTISEAFVGDPLPATGTLIDGLGTFSLDVTGEGSHNVIGYFDFEIFETFNTFFNESGSITGTPATSQSWEIDEPGLIFGDIVNNVFAGSLDNTNGVPAGSEDDTAFALGWDFSLLDGDIASIDFTFTDILPTVDFFLTQTDPDLGESLYFYSSLSIETTNPSVGPIDVPEVSSISLLVISILPFLASRRRRFN